MSVDKFSNFCTYMYSFSSLEQFPSSDLFGPYRNYSFPKIDQFDTEGIQSSFEKSLDIQSLIANACPGAQQQQQQRSSSGRSLNTRSSTELGALSHLNTLLERCLLPPITTHLHILNRVLLDHLLEERALLDLLAFVREVCLLGNGLFAHSLVCDLHEAIDDAARPVERLLAPSFLSALRSRAVQAALGSAVSGLTDANRRSVVAAIDPRCAPSLFLRYESLLSFAVNRSPATAVTSEGFVRTLAAVVRVDWPLNIIIDSKALRHYSELFAFRLQLLHALHTLDALWIELRCARRVHRLVRREQSEQLHKLDGFRVSMRLLLGELDAFVSGHALHERWHELRAGVLAVRDGARGAGAGIDRNQSANAVNCEPMDLDQLCARHARYLKSVRRACFQSRSLAPLRDLVLEMCAAAHQLYALASTVGDWQWIARESDARRTQAWPLPIRTPAPTSASSRGSSTRAPRSTSTVTPARDRETERHMQLVNAHWPRLLALYHRFERLATEFLRQLATLRDTQSAAAPLGSLYDTLTSQAFFRQLLQLY